MFKKIVNALERIVDELDSISSHLYEMKRYRRPSVGKCQDCIYWDRCDSEFSMGKCREANVPYGDWPIRKFDDWCGDFWGKDW